MAAEVADQAAKMAQCTSYAQTAASKSLAHASAIGGPDVLMDIIKYAKERVDCTEGSPEMAACALVATSRALASTQAADLNASLAIAE
eukprot:679847-Heterocapsa_arctica.AAC.1